ncbi:MAG: hypothetical protein IJT76_03320 [Clostridia bacterium]|nr:hypothetical protein [Clostridia bacterium]
MNALKKLRLAATILLVLLFIPFTLEVFGKLRPEIVRPLGVAMLLCAAVNFFCAIRALSDSERNN